MSYREDDICVIEFLHAPSGVTLNEAGDSGNVAGTRGGLASAPRGTLMLAPPWGGNGRMERGYYPQISLRSS